MASLAAAILAVALLSQPPREDLRGPYNAPLLPRLELLKVLGAGQRSLVADYFWLQAIQGAGRAGQSLERTRWLDTYYYSDLVTDLDPKFYKVYTFAGNAVATNLGRDTWVNTHEARRLLEKGVRHFPNDVDLRLFLAYNLSYFHREHERAARLLQEAAQLPGAPPVVGEMASRLFAHTGHYDAARAMAESFYRNAEDPELQELFEQRLRAIDSEQILRELDEAIDRFRSSKGRVPGSLSELVTAGLLTEVPADPMGGVFYIDEEGRAQSSVYKARLSAIETNRESEVNP